MIYDVAVIGCGASGMACAVTAARRGLSVLVLDKNTIPGRKLRATGNGRCNLANAFFDDTCYRGNGQEFIRRTVNAESSERVLDFFRRLGLTVTEKNGYYYPASMQASAVVALLQKSMERFGAVLCLGSQVTGISYEDKKYRIYAEPSGEYKKEQSRAFKRDKAVHKDALKIEQQKIYEAKSIVLATGGYAGVQYGCSGDGYGFAKAFGHHEITPRPGLVPLTSDEEFLSQLAGVRVSGAVSVDVDGSRLSASRGEIQFTDYGVSGICVFDISRFAVRALSREKQVSVSIDFLPEYVEEDYRPVFCELLSRTDYLSVSDILKGMLPEKLGSVILQRAGISSVQKACSLDSRGQAGLIRQMKDFRMNITGSRDYTMAQVTSGGIDTREVTEKFASKKRPELYLVGELLDVDGICGGYNLTFAFISGMEAGEAVLRK